MPPTPACAQGTTAPTARNLLATATPISPLSRSMATMENVLGWRSADNQRLQVFGIRGEDLAAVLGDDDRVGGTEGARAGRRGRPPGSPRRAGWRQARPPAPAA